MNIYIYSCNKCDYEVDSCGNLYNGFRSCFIVPSVCQDCKEVVDVNISFDSATDCQKVFQHYEETNQQELNPWYTKEESLLEKQKEILLKHNKDAYRCDACNGKNLVIWNSRYRKCPKCNGRMIKDPKSETVLIE